MLADVRGDGLPVNGLEDLLHRGGVHQEAARELVDGDAAGEVCGQRLVDATDGLKLLGAAPVRALERVRVERRQVRGGGDVLALLGAGDLHGALDHAVQQLRLFALRSLVVDLLAVAAADDQSALTQLAQVMRERGRAHAHHGREVDHALLAVAQKPEEPHAVCVGELAKDQRDGLKILGPAEVLLQFMQMRGVLVPMGKLKRFHISAPFPVVLCVESPVWQDFSPVRQRTRRSP